MAIVTLTDYRAITGDTTTASGAVASALDEAQDMVEEYLDAQIESAVRTEYVRIYPDRRAYPRAVPVTAITTPDGATIDPLMRGLAIVDVSPSDIGYGLGIPSPTHREPYAQIVYTGGWTADTVPRTVRRALAFLAKRLTELPAPTGSAGVRSASVGDVSVTYATIGEALDVYLPGITTSLAAYKRQELF